MDKNITITMTEQQAGLIRDVLLNAADLHTAQSSSDLLWAASCIADVGDEDMMNTLSDLFDVQGDNDYNLGLV